MILTRAQRWIIADCLMSHIDQVGITVNERKFADGAARFVECTMIVAGIDFHTTWERDLNNGVSVYVLTLETEQWKLTAVLSSDYLSYRVSGDEAQCDRDLSLVMLSGQIEGVTEEREVRTEAALARKQPPSWVARWAMQHG